jgi:hypothetical protein
LPPPISIPVGLSLLLMPGEHVLRRDVADGAVQTDVAVMVYGTRLLCAYFDSVCKIEAAKDRS